MLSGGDQKVVLTSSGSTTRASYHCGHRSRGNLRPVEKPEPEKKLELILYVSPDAWKPDDTLILEDPIERFNAMHVRAADGRIIEIAPLDVDSGRAEEWIERHPSEAPDVWIPASSIWSSLLEDEPGSIDIVNDRRLFSSPQVFAVWEPIAEKLKLGRIEGQELGWSDVLAFSSPDQAAWRSRVGQSFGEFTLAHTNPTRSTSGLSAAASEFYAASGRTEGLTESDVNDRHAQLDVQAMEQRILHYGPTSGDILEQFACYGQTYATAVYLQESSIGRFNTGFYDDAKPIPAWKPGTVTLRRSTQATERSSPTTGASSHAPTAVIPRMWRPPTYSAVGS